MPLTPAQANDLWREIQNGLSRLPFGIGRGIAISKADEAAQKIPPSLRDAKVGDVADQYLAWRRAGNL